MISQCPRAQEHRWLPVAVRGLRIGTWYSGSSTRNSPMMLQCFLCEEEIRRCMSIATDGIRVWQCDDPLDHHEHTGDKTHFNEAEDKQW